MIVYDCEIVKAIPSPREQPEPGVEYCNGWGDHAGMGISVIGVYDYAADRYGVYCKDNIHHFVDLVRHADVVVGFNNGGFDELLLKACLPEAYGHATGKSYDLLSEVWVAAGLPRRFGGPRSAGYGLDALARANGLPGKTGSGTHAPVLWQRGMVGEVIDYCLHDVWLTKKLLDKVIETRWLNDPKTGRTLANIVPPKA